MKIVLNVSFLLSNLFSISHYSSRNVSKHVPKFVLHFPASVSNAFQLADGNEFDLVVNCAGETKLGQSESVSHIDKKFYTIFIFSVGHCALLLRLMNSPY